MRWVSRLGRFAVALVVLPTLAGCYSFVPITTLQPAPGTKLSLVLNDEGRSQATHQVGPYTMKVEGELIQATDADYVLAVSNVVDIRGARSKWTGETVPLSRSFIMTTYERRFSKSRTVILAAAITSGLVALAAGFKILGFGGSGGNDGNQPPPNDQ